MSGVKHLQGVQPIPAGIKSYAELERHLGVRPAEERLQVVIAEFKAGRASCNDVRRELGLPPIEGWD